MPPGKICQAIANLQKKGPEVREHDHVVSAVATDLLLRSIQIHGAGDLSRKPNEPVLFGRANKNLLSSALGVSELDETGLLVT